MKYLKVFENHNDYYQEIISDEYYPLQGAEYSNCIDFIQNEKKKIRKLSLADGYQFRVLLGKGRKFPDMILILAYAKNINTHTQRWTICRMKDEWFLVKMHFIGDKYKTFHYYWKCDQMDGLVKLLKDKKIVI